MHNYSKIKTVALLKSATGFREMCWSVESYLLILPAHGLAVALQLQH
jgi:hypothetical protein